MLKIDLSQILKKTFLEKILIKPVYYGITKLVIKTCNRIYRPKIYNELINNLFI